VQGGEFGLERHHVSASRGRLGIGGKKPAAFSRKNDSVAGRHNTGREKRSDQSLSFHLLAIARIQTRRGGGKKIYKGVDEY